MALPPPYNYPPKMPLLHTPLLHIKKSDILISENRSCQPCGKDGCNGTKVSDCLMALDIENIKKDIKEILLEQSKKDTTKPTKS